MSQEWNPQDSKGEWKPNGPEEQSAPGRPFSTFRAQPATPPPPPALEAPKPRRSNTWIYGLIIAALLGTNIYLFMDGRKKANTLTSVTTELDTVIISRDNIQSEYNAALVRLDQLTSQNTGLKAEAESKNGEISKLRKQIEDIIRKENKSEADVARAQKLITQLRSKVRSFEDRIAELEGENATLTEQREVAVKENTTLQEKVKLGSVLHASNIRLTAIDLRRNGTKQRETEKARKADLLRIQFDIDENRIAESGPKELYIAVTGPDGTLLSNAAFGSGTTTTNEGTTLNYTMAKQVSLTENQMVRDVVLDWNQDTNYLKGLYSIEIYHEGFRIGSGSVILR
jgi:cell division protein FtsB